MAQARDIEKKIPEIVADQLGITEEDVVPSSSFNEDLGADSLDFLELIMAVEEEFSFDISDSDAESLETVGDLIDYVSTRTSM